MRRPVPPPAPEPEAVSSAVPSGSTIQATEPTRSSPRGLAGALATGLGVGLAPVAPGSFGSALGVLAFLPFLGLPALVFAAALLVAIGLGTWAAGVTQAVTGVRDDGRIVIDEIAGQLLTLAPLLGPRPGGGRLAAWLVTGFVTFRVLDIWKPGPVGWAERSFGGGLGVMADDLVAGGLGALVLGAGLAAGGCLS